MYEHRRDDVCIVSTHQDNEIGAKGRLWGSRRLAGQNRP